MRYAAATAFEKQSFAVFSNIRCLLYEFINVIRLVVDSSRINVGMIADCSGEVLEQWVLIMTD